MYLKNILSISLGLILFLAASNGNVLGYSFNPPDGLTGAPNEGNCTQCHAGNALNDSDGSLILTIPENYSPGETYDIVVKLSHPGQKRWGFEMTALNSSGTRAGTFATADGNTQVSTAGGKQYIKQTLSGVATDKADSNSWTFKWTAPTTDVGTITFYAAGNAANSDFTFLGDYIYTQKATSDAPPIYGLTLIGVGALTKQTADASSGVSYTLQLTNTGNTTDTFKLSTSGAVAATLSRTTVSLTPNASTQVTAKIAGTALSAAGTYDVKVTATSQGDSAQTADITTTTTVLPIYDVTLAGVGAVAKQTTDASAGVSYTLRITNTGNTTDTFRLSTSGDANATVNRTSVSLGRGASTQVTVTVSDPVLSTAGTYDVKVTATSQNDTTKTDDITTKTTVPPVYGVTLTGVGTLAKQTTDASTGISYTLKITNTGNTNDTFRLSTSGDANATLSRYAISLARGASTQVTVRVSGAALAAAGSYTVKVTATSQNDTTKTDDITTKTTVPPVYGVTLTGVGTLTKQTTDASTGISYTLKITNTGNTNDTFKLTTPGDVKTTLSQSTISLGREASTEVTLTVSDPALAAAGTYTVKVTAASQNDTTKTDDITTKTTILPVYGVALAGIGALEKETSDMSSGVSYTLQVKNTGNTDDTILLSSSAEVGIEGSVLGTFTQTGTQAQQVSQLEVTLAAGKSAEVIFTAAGDLFTKSGEYTIDVTATSQNDTTKTAKATTKTTVLPVYGVALAGVGALEKETSDVSSGVSYTLQVTNTGNTDDTILLSSSAEVGIEGSVLGTFTETGAQAQQVNQLEVTLAASASAEVIFTAAGDVFTKSGNYQIDITATSQNDTTKTAKATTKTTVLPIYGVALAGVDELTKEIATADEPVNYTFNITNTGNTADVIDIATTGDAAATLSQTTISLSAGASAEVTITVPTTALATAGDYVVTFTATSQGDSTKTAKTTTTTTLLPVTPVYGVMFEGDSERTGSTVDVLSGVSYTLTVTNTGNMDDTILLGSSAEAGIEGSMLGAFAAIGSPEQRVSQLEIMLAAGKSAEVIFTAAGDFFTKPGDYAIEVTATSQADSTKTAVLTITTTITPVPSDVNADGVVNILDLVKVANQFGEVGDGLVGDVNRDGVVNILDLVKVSSRFGKTQVEIVEILPPL